MPSKANVQDNQPRYKGVNWHPGALKWYASVTFQNFVHPVGYFHDRNEAALACLSKMLELQKVHPENKAFNKKIEEYKESLSEALKVSEPINIYSPIDPPGSPPILFKWDSNAHDLTIPSLDLNEPSQSIEEVDEYVLESETLNLGLKLTFFFRSRIC